MYVYICIDKVLGGRPDAPLVGNLKPYTRGASLLPASGVCGGVGFTFQGFRERERCSRDALLVGNLKPYTLKPEPSTLSPHYSLHEP